jgi:hypothetical protein
MLCRDYHDRVLIHEYEDGEQTGCPHLAFVRYCKTPHWIALKVLPPCAKKTCGMDGCHNFGRKDGYDQPSRVVLAQS